MDVKVSVIIPAYNVEQYVWKCIQSCCDQTYSNIEIIVVDDGSIDNTWKVIQKYSRSDERIICLKQENKGVSAARNAAIDVSTGDWLLFLDSDDWLEKDAVERLVAHVQPGDILICCDCYFVYGSTDNQRRVCQNGKYYDDLVTQHELMKYIGLTSKFRLVSSCYKLFDKSIIDKNEIRFTPGIHQGEDGLFTFQYICHIDKAIYFRDPLWNIYDRPGSACNSPYSAKWKTALDAINKMIDYGANLSNESLKMLKAYQAERAMWLETNCVISDAFSEDDFLYYRNVLKNNGKYLVQREKRIKTVFQIIVYAMAPAKLSKAFISVIQHLKNN